MRFDPAGVVGLASVTDKLPIADILVLVAYVVGVVGLGCYFVRRSRTTEGFTAAGRSLPGWAVGLSIFGTYLSSNTFVGAPGKAYGTNWNSFVFSLSIPVAAVIAVIFFVPFYRRSGGISAYEHLERRFGPWARTCAMVCYLLTQVTRMGSIMFGVALVLRALLGLDAATIILAMGALVTLYTLVGGIEAVIWTDVVQSIVLTVGAIVIAAMLLLGMPQGPGQVFSIGSGKFSLGGFDADFTVSTFWVVLLYGVFMNLNNFGIDQNYVQRYHTARSEREAKRSVWLGAMLYLPISLLFFFIGSCLFAYYRAHPEMLDEVRRQVAAAKLASERPKLSESAYQAKLASTAAALKPEEIGDKILPHYIVHGLPTGMTGLLIAALFAAAMSTIDTSLNSSATITLTDIYRRYVRRGAGERESMRVLHVSTLVWGAAGTGVALALIGVESLLDAWWVLSGIFVGGMLGLFLLGLIWRRARSAGAAVGACVGIVVILWMSLSLLKQWPRWADAVRSPLHKFMIPVVGTSTIVLMAMLASLVIPRRSGRTAP